MIQELDAVVLSRDFGEHQLRAGDVGAVVHCFPETGAFEVEFVTGEGRTAALLTLSQADIRPMRDGEILHARDLSGA